MALKQISIRWIETDSQPETEKSCEYLNNYLLFVLSDYFVRIKNIMFQVYKISKMTINFDYGSLTGGYTIGSHITISNNP